jgi:hypothetical protein
LSHTLRKYRNPKRNLLTVLKETGDFPFVPKSTKRLTAGDFWAIPLRDARFACGRVVELRAKDERFARVHFLGGLLDWQGLSEPTTESIAGCSFIAQGVMHIRAIMRTGGRSLGHRDFALDSLGPWTFIYGSEIRLGFRFVRPWNREDNWRIPTLSAWSPDAIQVMANQYFIDYLVNNGKRPWWFRPS